MPSFTRGSRAVRRPLANPAPAAGLTLLLVMPTLMAMGVADEPARWAPDKPGPFQVAVEKHDWKDESRDRVVPVTIHRPIVASAKTPAEGASGTNAAPAPPFPVIVFSHGLGGTRDGYGYLGRFWASHGYVVVHPQHIGSDDATWRGQADPINAMKKSTRNLSAAFDRPRDVSFVLDQLAKEQQRPTELKGLLDLTRVGVGGHSFGANTTLMIAGQGAGNPLGRMLGGRAGKAARGAGAGSATGFKDPRVKTILPLSAPVPAPAMINDRTYAAINVPVMHMTGTLDESPIADTKAEHRRIPFDRIAGVDQWFINFRDGDHMLFSGRPRGTFSKTGTPEKDREFQRRIERITLAFWDATLRDHAGAKSWLDHDMKPWLGPLADSVERKRAGDPGASKRTDAPAAGAPKPAPAPAKPAAG
jgi:predicted dienelactone hydrolase